MRKKIMSLSLTISMIIMCSLLVVTLVYGWYTNRQDSSVSTGTVVVTPQTFAVGAGKNDDIANLSMGNIDVLGTTKETFYCFSVIGKPATNYLIQLAYTTNINFKYEIYDATLKYCSEAYDYETFDMKTISLPALDSVENPDYTMSYSSTDGKTYYFKTKTKIAMNELNVSEGVADDTYTNNNYGLYSKFQTNSNPVYLQSNVITVSQQLDYDGFEHYYIIRISWDNLTNNKEVDQVYLTVTLKQ